MSYIGENVAVADFSKQTFTANSSTTVFTLDCSVANSSCLIVSVGGVIQEPDVAYTASATTLTFSVAPTTGNDVYVIYMGKELPVTTHGDNTITNALIPNAIITSDKIQSLVTTKLTGALPAIDGSALTGVSVNTDSLEDNIAMLGFKLASNNSLAKYNLVDRTIDEYQDATGIDASASTGEIAGGTGTGKYYSSGTANAAMSLQSTSTTASTAPTKGDMTVLIEDNLGTATINTDIKGYVSRNGGTGWDQGTLVHEGTWGTNRKVLSFHDKTFSNSASGTDMKYKIETANQSYVETVTIQGYAGGVGVAGTANGYASGGGGGAGGAGIDGTASSNFGNGGVGRTSSIDGTPTFRGGGGGGGAYSGPASVGGNGGGGAGAGQTGHGTVGTANTGGGGGGSGRAAGGNGGSGIVIIRALTSETSGSTGNWDTTGTDGSHTWYKWTTVTSAGTFTPSQSASYEYLVIAGGGAGFGPQGGGGGAGGYLTGTLTVSSAVTGITVGAGAVYASPPNNIPIVGDNSVFSTITSLGGGGGGGGTGALGTRPAKDGGSGGGGAGDSVGGNNPDTIPGDGTSTTDISGKQTRIHATSLAWS